MIPVGSYWYEDDEKFERDPNHHRRYGRVHGKPRPRATGRIVRVVGQTNSNLPRIQNVGGRWVPDGKIGESQTTRWSRFNIPGGFLPLPPEHFDAVRYTEGIPPAIT